MTWIILGVILVLILKIIADVVILVLILKMIADE